MLTIEVQRGEWWEVGGTITDRVTKLPRDVSGRVVAAVLRDGQEGTANPVTVEGGIGIVLDGPSGTVAVGGRVATAGRYYGTVEVGAAADGAGWPAKERFILKVTDCP